MGKFLWLKELHRLPPSPSSQTSTKTRYLTTNTNAAQRLRAMGLRGPAKLTAGRDQHTPFHCASGNFRLRRNQPFEALTFA
jgi:hypothetical protein